MSLATLPQTMRSNSRDTSRHRRSTTLPSRLPEIVPKSTLIAPIIADLNPTTRINVLHPPTVPRRTVFLETAESQHHMHKRCALMRHQQWMRDHEEWQKPLYGTPEVKEDYKFRIRETLKTQMDYRRNVENRKWSESINESVMTSQKDYNDQRADLEKRLQRRNFLTQYTRANKEMMELRWKEKKEEKILENKRDSEQLKYNPINWRHTLK